MSRRKRRNLLVCGLQAVTLAAVIIAPRHCPGNRSGGDENRGMTLAEHTLPVQALAFGLDGTTLTSDALYTDGHKAGLEGYQGKVKCLAYSADGTRLASGSYDRTVRRWDVAGYRPRRP